MTDARRRHLGRLARIEQRSLSTLAPPDFAALRATTNARESGVDLRGPDTLAAERHLLVTRDAIMASLERLVEDTNASPALVLQLEEGVRLLERLARAVDLIETTLYPRLNNPPIEVGAALERAASARVQTVSVQGDSAASVHQVRGLLRLFSELIACVGDHAYVHVTRNGPWVELLITPNATDTGEWAIEPDRGELIRLAAYLIRARAEATDGGWRLALVLADPG